MAHAVKIIMSDTVDSNPNYNPTPEPPELPDVVSDRVQQNIDDVFERVKENLDIGPKHITNYPDIQNRIVIYRRFPNDESISGDAIDKLKLLDEFEKKVCGDASDYVIQYHRCRNDIDSDNTDCPNWEIATDSKGNEYSHGNIRPIL